MTSSNLPLSEVSDPFADRRVHPRVSVALPAFLSVGGQRYPVQILDLSSGGAKLRGEVPPVARRSVVLDCGSASGAAVVRWQEGPCLGLSFDREMDAREVGALADRSAALMARMGG